MFRRKAWRSAMTAGTGKKAPSSRTGGGSCQESAEQPLVHSQSFCPAGLVCTGPESLFPCRLAGSGVLPGALGVLEGAVAERLLRLRNVAAKLPPESEATGPAGLVSERRRSSGAVDGSGGGLSGRAGDCGESDAPGPVPGCPGSAGGTSRRVGDYLPSSRRSKSRSASWGRPGWRAS
jgi:hypothetical protein